MSSEPITAAVLPAPPRALSPAAQNLLKSAAIIAVLVGIWELLAVTVFAGRFVLPSPQAVLSTAVRDDFYLDDVRVTLSISWKGYLLGNAAALLLAAICLILPLAEHALLTLGVATYCVPTIAVGPLFVVLYGAEGAKVAMSALSVFFITLVAAVTGLRAASPTSLEMITAFGGSRLQQLVRVRARASIPTLAGALCIAAPAAILGTMIGDYLGGERGLGVIMLQAQQQLDVRRTWAIALVSTAVCAVAFAATSLLAKLAAGSVDVPLDAGISRARRHGPTAVVIAVVRAVAAILVGLLVWEILIRSSGLSSYFVKSPADVWRYLISGPEAAAHRDVLNDNLVRTLRDAAGGWLLGTVVAVVGAAALVLVPRVGAVVMPFVVVLRSVPLIAMCPLIGLVFGRDILGITIIGALVTFVPSIVTLANGLRGTPRSATDVVHCFGGSNWSAFRIVRLPFAGPSLFAAAKISMPGAVLGAVLAEWLITGHGIGHAMSYDIITSNYAELWSSIAVLLVVSLGLYALVSVGEGIIRRRVDA